MSLSDQVANDLPFLRRYARALSGSQTTGDAVVRATLEAILADKALQQSLSGGRVPLYHAFNRVWSSVQLDIPQEVLVTSGPSDHELAAQDRLRTITPLNRQALLLTTLEDFSVAEAAEILGLPQDEVDKLVRDAIDEIDRESTTSVLIH